MALRVIVLAALAASGSVSAFDQSAASVANPVRKVVTLLQNMEKKVRAEGEKEDKLYEKFMCYCKNAGGELSTSIAEAETKLGSLPSAIQEAEASKSQLESELKTHQSDRSAAKGAIADAEALRAKAAAEFAKEKAELEGNIDTLGKASAAISKGMTGFLQTTAGQSLKKLLLAKGIQEADRQDIMAFLSDEQSSEYAPQSGQIVGILSTMKEEMSKSLAEAEAAEAEAVKAHAGLMAAKGKEIQANTQAIEAKTVRIGDLAVSIVGMKNDLTDTEAALAEDKKFVADLGKNCATQTAERDANQKMRAQELVAIADVIKLLNDDDALDLFKKTLPSASASLIQFDFITLAMQGKQQGFEKVVKMIDEMVSTIKKEQLDDEHKKEYCGKQFDFADDKKKAVSKSVEDLGISIENAKESVATLASEIEELEDSIKALDKSVAEATDDRKEAHEDFVGLMSSDTAAKELLKLAINRLNKFYNPALYKPAPKRELSESERITLNMGGTLAPTAAPGGIANTGITALAQSQKGAPPPPPAAVSAYKSKGEESNGVVTMLNLLVSDLDKEMDEAQTAEKDAQADYEQMLSDSAEKRALAGKALTEKNAAKAGLQSDVESDTDAKNSAVKELMATDKYISSLHAECDWLIQYFDARTAARSSEIDSLTQAKAVLNGADYSLLQEAHLSQVQPHFLEKRQ